MQRKSHLKYNTAKSANSHPMIATSRARRQGADAGSSDRPDDRRARTGVTRERSRSVQERARRSPKRRTSTVNRTRRADNREPSRDVAAR